MKPNETPEVDQFLRELSHPLKDAIANVRAAILASDEQITEWASGDRATVTLHDPDDVQAKLPTVVELVGRWMRATA